LLAMGMTGWWGVQTELFANAVVQLANHFFHITISREIMIVIGGAAMIVTAALGIRAIGRLSYLAVPLLTAGLIYALISLGRAGNLTSIIHYHPATSSALSWGAAAAIVASGFIVGASMNPDYARFAINKKHAFGYAFTDYAFIYPLLLIASGVIAISFNTKEIMVHLVPPGYTWLVFVMMMFATWAANDCNLYSSSLSLAAVLPKLQRSHLAILAGVFGIYLAEIHVAEHMVSFLTLLGILISPISGVFIINAIGRKHPILFEELSQIPDWRFAQLIAWFSGALLGYMTTPKNDLGLGLFKLTTVPTLDAVIGSACVMLAIKIIENRTMRAPNTVPNALITGRSYASALDESE